ncbi:PTS sorbitol transporter subunit IIA [Lactobacillus sp. ESL0230]|nr:PTS glucitol/sorbitol transporter subunit IIA [Lactobacillus sp. ESL0230]RMC46092.1 PTS sorbitol transporter subunit IIA [Lactobacillus sp. ESL0230]
MVVTGKPVFKTIVKEIGKEAQQFKSINMLIFFGEQAPNELRDSCFIIADHNLASKIKEGMTLKIGAIDYQITAVGDEVNANLQNLGHIAVKFTGEKKAELPGSLYVEKKAFPKIEIGTEIEMF